MRFNFYDYQVQTVSSGSSLKRELTTLTATLRCERKVWKKLKLFAEHEHEENLSNRRSNEYTANMVLGGIDWEL